jgi:hypothetical protein
MKFEVFTAVNFKITFLCLEGGRSRLGQKFPDHLWHTTRFRVPKFRSLEDNIQLYFQIYDER